MTNKQKEDVAKAFATSNSEIEFDQKLKNLGLDDPEYEDEIANLLFGISTNKVSGKIPQ